MAYTRDIPGLGWHACCYVPSGYVSKLHSSCLILQSRASITATIIKLYSYDLKRNS